MEDSQSKHALGVRMRVCVSGLKPSFRAEHGEHRTAPNQIQRIGVLSLCHACLPTVVDFESTAPDPGMEMGTLELGQAVVTNKG